MWTAKFRIKHDCMLGNRCSEFNISLQSISFLSYEEDGRTVTPSLHTMSGSPERMDAFIEDLKKDRKALRVERKGDTFFLLVNAEDTAVQFHTPKLIFVKPVLMDTEGNEFWEVASWEKEEVNCFLEKVRNKMDDFELTKIVNEPIDNVFFPKLMPNLSENQKRAFELALNEGYYEVPKSVGMRELAKKMDVSLSTFQEHLRKAEHKILPTTSSHYN